MDYSTKYGNLPSLNRSRIYNFSSNKKPAELFRKDLISAMKLPDSEQLCKDDYWFISDTWKQEWEKGVQVPVNPDALNSSLSNVRIVENNTSANSGDFKFPKKLIKADNNASSDYSNYELDLTDLCWLKALEESDECIRISEYLLSSFITELEIQCAASLEAKKIGIEFDDHVLCDVCKSPDGEDNNEMVFCDSCNICVHQACYGIKSIPSGDWLCSPCNELGSQKNVSCVLCPNIGGAFKPTSNSGQWAHVSCALWVPEVIIVDVEVMEPITNINQIPSKRWNLMCSICNVKKGTPIQCSARGCKVSYHITCAFKEKIRMKAIVENNKQGVKLKSYCKLHSQDTDKKEQSQSGSFLNKSSNEIDFFIDTESVEQDESNLAFWKHIDWKVIEKKFEPILKKEFPKLPTKVLKMYTNLMFHYWKLKRHSLYGAPLIKIMSHSTMEEIKHKQRMDILRLRVDLERIRNLSYMLIKREKLKKSWLSSHKAYIEKALQVANELSSSGNKPLKFASKLESPTQTQLYQKQLRNADDINLIKDAIETNNIYANCKGSAEQQLKIILKRFNRLSKIEKTNEILKRPKINPYAKPYVFCKREQSDTLVNCDSRLSNSLINNNSPRSFPLKSKSIPSNLKNSSHDLKSLKTNKDITSLDVCESTAEKKRKYKKKTQKKPQNDEKIWRLRNSPKNFLRLSKAEVKSSNRKSTQENLTSKQRVTKKLNFKTSFKKSSIHRKCISTRSQINNSLKKL